jgi:hypothetical protein
MDVLEAGIKHAAATNNKELSNQINKVCLSRKELVVVFKKKCIFVKILENISKLEEYGMVTKDDNYESFVHAVALEVANRATIRENQRKEISRLNAALNKLRQHQAYIKVQCVLFCSVLLCCVVFFLLFFCSFFHVFKRIKFATTILICKERARLPMLRIPRRRRKAPVLPGPIRSKDAWGRSNSLTRSSKNRESSSTVKFPNSRARCGSRKKNKNKRRIVVFFVC